MYSYEKIHRLQGMRFRMGTLLVERYVRYRNVTLWDVSVDGTSRKILARWELLGSVSVKQSPSRLTRLSSHSRALSDISNKEAYQEDARPFQHRHPCVSYSTFHYTWRSLPRPVTGELGAPASRFSSPALPFGDCSSCER